MRDLFDRLKRDGYHIIQETVQLRTQETVQLDFKLKESQINGQLSKNDRGVLGPAISAFANSAGGLLIWGIEAKKDADGVDAAQCAVPIPDLSRFRSEVTRAVGELLAPRYDGIEVIAVDDPNVAGAGYLAIWVDRSDRRPHRSEAANDKRYYKRAGDSTFIMEHYDLEDAFNRSAPVDLRLVFDDFRSESREVNTWRVSLKYSLINDERRSACAPYAWVEKVVGGRTVQTVTGAQSKSTLTDYHHPPKIFFQGDGSIFVHPSLSVPAFDLVFVVEFERTRRAYYLGADPIEDARVSFDFGTGCMNARMKAGHVSIEGNALKQMVEGGVSKAQILSAHQPLYHPSTEME